MGILEQLQVDLLDPSVALSVVLRKALVLSHQLQSNELEAWVDQELDGYKSRGELPDYRILPTECTGFWMNGYWRVKDQPVPLYKVKNEKVHEMLTKIHVFDGIRTVEQYAATKDLRFGVPADLVALANRYLAGQGGSFLEMHYTVGHQLYEQILDTVRNRHYRH